MIDHKATYKISATYFPHLGEVELTWENLDTGEECSLTKHVTEAEGKRLAKVVPCCVYHGAHNDK